MTYTTSEICGVADVLRVLKTEVPPLSATLREERPQVVVFRCASRRANRGRTHTPGSAGVRPHIVVI